MKVIKKIFLILFIMLDAFFLYQAIGSLIYAIKTPQLVGLNTISFMGMYMVSAMFAVLFVLLTIVLVLRAIYLKKNKKK